MNLASYKCPCCGAPLTFDGASQKLQCNSCGNAFDVESIEQLAREDERTAREDRFEWSGYESVDTQETVVYTCPSCGGEIIGDAVTAAARCPYCDNNVVMREQVSGVLKPDLIIPFQTTKQQAEAALKAFYKGKKLLPDAFRSENRIQEIRGIYVPFWLFSCDADAGFTYDCTRVSSWRSGDYQYTKTDHFAAVREGGVAFDRIPVDASGKMPDDLMDSIEPYDYSAAIDFETAYLSGFLADKFDVDWQSSLPRANERIVNSVSELFRDTVQGYASVTVRAKSVQTANGKIRYALLPVWILNTKYRDQLYTFAMNGQTGKLIGNLPVDRGKYWRRFLITAAAIALPIITVLLLKGGGLL